MKSVLTKLCNATALAQRLALAIAPVPFPRRKRPPIEIIVAVLAATIFGSSINVSAKVAARSTHVIIKNDTDRNLTFVSGSVQHGIVTQNPPSIIAPSGIGELFAESNGVATGTEGTVTYQVTGVSGTASFHWDNPYVGSNSANGSAPPGFQVEQIGDTGNRTLVFFSIHAVNQATAICNPEWVLQHLGTHAEDSLDDFDKAVGFLTTPLKRMGIGGWVDTGCDATAEGWPVRDAQHSTDGFWTIDVKLQQFTINGNNVGKLQRFVRIEVEPGTPAHGSAAAKANSFIRFNGRVLIDTHHGDELIEVHPWDPITLAPEPSVPGGPTQFIGRFSDAPFFRPVWLYVIKNDGTVFWYRHQDAATGTPSGFMGPKTVITPLPLTAALILRKNHLNWAQFRDVISAGGANFYARTEAGDLLWYQHIGFNDGSENWNGPIKVATGWQRFKKIFSGGDGVVYGIDEAGDLYWYRHAGYATGGGPETWTRPIKVGTGWGDFKKVFSAGSGVIYATGPNGDLFWYRHNYYMTGSPDNLLRRLSRPLWSGPVKVRSIWDSYVALFSPGDGVIYAVQADGGLVWYRHSSWNDEVATQALDGPKLVGSGWAGFRTIVPLMPVTKTEQPR
jgi:hypothetical protein